MQGTPKAIQIQGIVRNTTVIGAQDGQAEDLINLRFMDGSWRASGDGRLINFTMGAEYSQLYVHTNVYHHLLGVAPDPNNNDTPTLWWFAEIGTDGVSFYPLDGTTSRTNWPQDMQSLPTSPVALTTVVGDIWITQTGHLLTIIDENDDFEYYLFKTDNKEYINVEVDVNGKQTARGIYPFGQVHFNFNVPKPDILLKDKRLTLTSGAQTEHFTERDMNIDRHTHLSMVRYQDSEDYEAKLDKLKALAGEMTQKNVFTGAVLACAALKLYDGSYIYASNPVLVFPRQQAFNKKLCFVKNGSSYDVTNMQDLSNYDWYNRDYSISEEEQELDGLHAEIYYTYDSEADFEDSYHVKTYPHLYYYTLYNDYNLVQNAKSYDDILPPLLRIVSQPVAQKYFARLGYDLVFSIEDTKTLFKYKDVFTDLCIFVTPEVEITNLNDPTLPLRRNMTCRDNKDILHDLMSSPMYLLKKYPCGKLPSFDTDSIVDLTDKEDEGLLMYDNLVQQDRLTTEAFTRTTYLPKVSYMYNGRLHIANYKSYPFFGYPIDLFHLHNHSVKVQANSWFKGVLPNLAENNDEYLQYAKTSNNFPSTIPSGCTYFAFIEVTIDSSQGEQKVVRYIEPYAVGNGQNGRADFIESLNPLITYPDARAKHIKIVRYVGGSQYGNARKVEFDLKPHPYLNMAYYIDPDLKPISLSVTSAAQISTQTLPMMVNTEEYFPNGLKVSKTDNPMFFPVENAYQVGSAEILALMSNTIAVGTGQTGAAPLYVFCKDGVYALFVDASGQMTYSNSRVLARDVCNNPRSVTPIDAGVVFTTDRGLMMIAGEQVEEIGQPAEGDVLQYVDSTKVDYSKYAFDALTKIAGLPSSLCDTTDFLTYLQDKGTLGKAAIVNYNHNMRELIISNPNYAYSYVLDREGNWSRRDYTAAEYVNNYPTSYRVAVETVNNQQVRRFYKLDDEGDASTSLEHRKEADNKIFYLSNVIKLDSIGFKQAYRFVVRGYFEAQTDQNVGIVVEGSYDGIKFAPLGFNRKTGKFTDIGCNVSHTDMRFYRVILCGQVTGKTRINYMELSADGSKLNTKIR